MTKLKARLEAQLNAIFAGNATELARRLETTQQNVSNFISGKVKRPHFWRNAARLLEIPEAELDELIVEASDGKTRSASRNSSEPSEITLLGPRPQMRTFRMIPVLGEAVGGSDGEYIFNGSVIDYVACPPSLEGVTNAYAVFVAGESMAPRYRPGEVVWVHPHKQARRGDDVIVQIRATEESAPPRGYIKEFVGRTASKLILQQHNPANKIEFDLVDVVSVHPIVFSEKY